MLITSFKAKTFFKLLHLLQHLQYPLVCGWCNLMSLPDIIWAEIHDDDKLFGHLLFVL